LPGYRLIGLIMRSVGPAGGVSGDGFDYHEDVLKPDKQLLLMIVVSASPSSRPKAIYMLALGNFMAGM
jgi:hypothetical protein